MSRMRQRADRIHEEIPIIQVLLDYGYNVHPDGGDREQQFPCDLHGDGLDNKPSARVYPDSKSYYCFACNRTRDAIQIVREKEGLEFWPAVRLLEQRYGLPTMPWEDMTQQEIPTPNEEIRKALQADRTFEQERKRVSKLLDTLTMERGIPMNTNLGLWEAFDRICWSVSQDGGWPEIKGKEALLKLRDKALLKLREAS